MRYRIARQLLLAEWRGGGSPLAHSMSSSGRSAAHRREGAGRSTLLARWFRKARQIRLPLRRRRSAWRDVRWPLAAYAPSAVALAVTRRRVGVPPAVTLPVISVAPLALAAATPRGKWRYIAVGATYMWVFKLTWELPYDQPERLRRRLRVRYPIRLDSLIGAGVPPTLRLQRALRDPPRLTLVDKAVTVVYGSWFVPHLGLGGLLLPHDQFVPRAAGRLAAGYHRTPPFYWLLPTAPPSSATQKG